MVHGSLSEICGTLTPMRPWKNHYVPPKDGMFRCLNISGGRSSAYMLYKIVEANGGLPKKTMAIFTNTGKEREETLEFLRDLERFLEVDILWLEYDYDPDNKGGLKDPKNTYFRVDFRTASRHGEPFEKMLHGRNMLPHKIRRVCTSELKVQTTRRFLYRELGIRSTEYRSVLGIRKDEPRRWGQALLEECLTDYPLVYADVTVDEVNEFWNSQPFDLKIPSSKGNCDLCFMKGKGNLIETIRQEPHRVDWWIHQEKRSRYKADQKGLRKKSMCQFAQNHTFTDLKEQALSGAPISPEDMEDQGVDCFCTD